MYKKSRQLHLWIGLICSVFILVQAITGLLMLEPWIIGGSEREELGGFPQQMRTQQMNDAGMRNPDANGGMPQMEVEPGADANGEMPQGRTGGAPFPGNGNFGSDREGGQGVSGFIKNLHKGQIGSTDISWVLSIAAVGLIMLTLTGIVLSTKILAAQSSRRSKRKVELQE